MKFGTILLVLPVHLEASVAGEAQLPEWLSSIVERAPAAFLANSDEAPLKGLPSWVGNLKFDNPTAVTDIRAEPAAEMLSIETKSISWPSGEAASRLSGLTLRQRQVLEMVLDGNPSKNIAADLGISQRTVENHRAAIMKRTGSKSIPALARLAAAANWASG